MSLLALALMSSVGTADPCGMVPPLTAVGTTIQRDGAQRTYIMHSRGMETMVLRPGFIGDVEQFGMLIPFPTPPAIRKIDDQTFAHIEGAVAPPTVQVNIYEPMPVARGGGGWPGGVFAQKSATMSAPPMEEAGLGYMEVNVVRQEALGMYEVAVLEAGSPKALDRWMSDNGYKYPDGMDDVVRDYVQDTWCFVAIKAKVGGAEGTTPRPGMRDVDTGRPEGSSFDGHVQGMGFRFETPEPVVPMRLSVFNGADPRNVVYMLTDDPVRITGQSTDLVAVQISGDELHSNLTKKLPVNYPNLGKEHLREEWRPQVAAARDPDAVNGIARELFAADLLAARTGQLTLAHEAEEKELLNLSEAFGMRGEDIDGLHRQAMTDARALAVDGALDDVREMHLTVFDGVFDGEQLAKENLTFETWTWTPNSVGPRQEPLRPTVDPLTFWL
jgi:hypothetical protein